MLLAEAIAREAHKDQKRYDGSPYIRHPEAVAEMVKDFGPKFVEVAWLHDVIEDCDLSKADLLEKGIDPEIAEAVQLLTRREGEPYEDYLRGLDRNILARTVKVFDILHNLSDTPTKTQVKRYASGLIYLLR